MVTKHGKNWQTVAFAIPGREAKQCQIRWTRSLDPAIKKQDWSEQEDLKLIRAHQIYGSQWLKMVKHFPGRTNHALKEHWRNRIKGKLNFYLASGLLEQVPDLEEGGISVPESSQSEIPKDSQGSADRSGPPPVLRAQPKSKPELPENAGTSGEGTSDSIRLKGPNAHPTEVSEKVLAKSKQRARARRRLDFLSTPVELKLCTAAASCQRPPQKMDQPGPVAENISPSDACQDISQNVPPERADAITPLAASNHHSPATPVDPFSLEMHEANASDLLDMSYCDGLIIDSPRDPHDGSLM
ncbi:Myb-related protein 3R-1 [Zea mays]|nr:Myb-related protein 3R-1 [Zea mays]AQK69889.1 Myb-related protein 3R-1 [Zea mays]AQK69891.1 Myb-related protein 3R-1 [Zea mays]